jgi:hypothetical protein
MCIIPPHPFLADFIHINRLTGVRANMIFVRYVRYNHLLEYQWTRNPVVSCCVSRHS